jgi:hypothetical protein
VRRPVVYLSVALFAAVVGPRIVGPQARSAGAPFAYEPPEGFARAKEAAADQEGATVWVYAGEAGLAQRDPARLVLTRSAKEMSVEERDLATLADEMPAAFEGLCTWRPRRHEMRVRTDGARVGLIEGDCDRTRDVGAPVKARKLQLMFPDDQGTWIVTASYPTEEAVRWAPLIEATIGRTRGVAVRVPSPPIWVPAVWALAGAVLAWLATALFARGPGAAERTA